MEKPTKASIIARIEELTLMIKQIEDNSSGVVLSEIQKKNKIKYYSELLMINEGVLNKLYGK